MTTEPITLFARIADPARIARQLRELAPKVEIDGPDDAWHNARVTFGEEKNKRTLTFTRDPDYDSEPNWSTQMSGMRGYFSRFPETDRKDRAMMLTTSFTFSLGTFFEPDFDPQADPRLDVLFAVAEILDGVLFTPASLRDAHGRILFGAGGEDEEDPDAVWPRVVASVSLADPAAEATAENSTPQKQDEDAEIAEPPTADRLARRALALAAVTARAILEQGSNLPRPRTASQNLFRQGWRLLSGHEAQRRELVAWIDAVGINDEFEPDEWEVLQRPVGRLDQRSQIDSTWKLEGLVVLAWALGRFEVPPHDRLVKPNPLWRSLELLDTDAARLLLSNPTLRPRAEIGSLRNRLFALHWRLRNFHINPGAMDFADYARTCWFGPLDVSGLPLIDGDLGLGGKRIDRAPPDAFSSAHSAAQERHQAANWLWEGPERYSDASVDT